MGSDPTNTRRVLIIDDDPAIHADFKKALGSRARHDQLASLEANLFGRPATAGPDAGLAFQVDSAFQGQEGLKAVQEAVAAGRPYAVAFLDMRMPPGWDGLETLEHLWTADANLQIVICTAFTDHPWERITERCGDSDRLVIIKKPFDRVEAHRMAVMLTTKWNLARQTEISRRKMEEEVQKRIREAAAQLAASEQEQIGRLERLQRQHAVVSRLFTDPTLATSGLEMVADTICELASDALEVERTSVWTWEQDRKSLRCITQFERATRSHARNAVLRAPDCPAYCEALRTARAIDAGDALNDPRTAELAAACLAPLGISSRLDAGVRVGSEVIGLLCCEHVGPTREWQDDEVSFAGVIADHLAQLMVHVERTKAEEALRESETRLQTIVDSIQAGLMVVDAQTRTIVDANPAALAMIGSTRAEVLGKVCHNFVCPNQTGQCPVLDHGQCVDNSERVLVKKGGERLSILKTVVPITLRGRAHLLESFIDITEQRRVREELAAHRERLEEMVAERSAQLVEAEHQVIQAEKLASVGRLAAGVAHEINTPIQYVGDNLHALSEAFEDLTRLIEEYRKLGEQFGTSPTDSGMLEQVRETERAIDLPFILEDTPKAITQALEGVQRVAMIVRSMKDFSHVKGGTTAVVDLNQSIQSTLTVARNEYKYHADVETEFGQLPAVECYPSELNQVFLNLLVNAAHAIQDTGRRGKITITTRPFESHVEVAISDTGTGIPEEIREKIFDLFFTTKEVGRGTGQGLALARQIVVGKHGGELRCASEVGKGTTFTIQIPIRVPAVAPDPADPQVQEEPCYAGN